MRKAARWPQAHRNGCEKAAAQDSQRKGSRACAAAVTKLRPASVRCGAEFFVSVLRRVAPVRRASDAQRMTEVAATDEVDAGYTLHDRRCGRCRSPSPAAACVIPCFQFSMLLHNLSSIFSLSKKVSQRALRCTRVPHRTAATTRQPKASTTPAPAESTRRTVPDQKPLPHPHVPPVGTPPCSAAPAPDHARPERLEASFPHVFHIFAGFQQRLSFPLAFFERDRVRYALPYVPAVR